MHCWYRISFITILKKFILIFFNDIKYLQLIYLIYFVFYIQTKAMQFSNLENQMINILLVQKKFYNYLIKIYFNFFQQYKISSINTEKVL